MKKLKIIAVLLIIEAMTAMTACSNQTEQPNIYSEYETSSAVSLSDPPYTVNRTYDSQPVEACSESNILIAYFTWAENTYVDDPSVIDTDAVTSASVLMPGNVGLLAQWIQEETNGDTFSIIAEKPYSSNYDDCLDRAIDEHDSEIRPPIIGSVENIEDYEIVFIGFPNWWYSCPMAVLTFIENNDLSGKTIVPFCSHGTGGFAASLQDIEEVLPDNCTILKEFGAYRPDVKNSRDDLVEWLSELDISY